MKVRCSKLPLFFECASSADVRDGVSYNPGSDAAELGVACHEALALVVLGEEPDLASIAQQHDADEDELRRLVAYGRQAWSELRAHMPSPKAEQRVDSPVTGGTADVLQADGESLFLVDWKSGWLRSNHRHQLRGYAHAAVATYGMPASGYVTIATVWLRFGEIEVERLDSAALDSWEWEYAERVREIGTTWNPGPHCAFCPAQLSCSARTDYLRAAGSALAEIGSTEISPTTLAKLYPQSRMLKRALEAFDAALREHVRAAGSLALGDGTSLTLEERKRQDIDAQAAWPVLEELGFTDDDFARVLSVSKGEVEALVGERAEPRGKGKAKAAAIARLRDAGAITVRPYQVLTTTKDPDMENDR